ncbi:MAG TPA: host attachment protein [Pirellulales bacterium]|nr:host attachment protein [Pirellulales bacterium]
MNTWILVADSSRARIFAASQRGKPWTLVADFEHPETRERTAEYSPTERGSQKQAFGYGRPAMEPKTEPRRVEKGHFAEELADRLDTGLRQGEYGALVLVASPQFLGDLKGKLDKQVAKCVTGTIDKDYTHLNEREVVERLEDTVWGVSV